VHLWHDLFLTWTQNLIIYRSCITIFTRQTIFNPTLPLAPLYPLFTYRENQLLSSWYEYPSTLVPGLLTAAPPFASSPTLSHPRIKLQYLHRQHQQHQLSSLGTVCSCGFFIFTHPIKISGDTGAKRQHVSTFNMSIPKMSLLLLRRSHFLGISQRVANILFNMSPSH
jgi:hypothetical protein